FKKSDFIEAEKTFARVTAIKPENIEGWNNLGIVQVQLGHIEQARESFSRILALEPNNSGALLNLGNYYSQKGEYATARNLFKKALEFRADFIDAWFNLGNTELALGEYKDAIAAYEKAVKYKPDFASAFKNMGYAFEKLGDLECAVQKYQCALDLNKADTGLWVNLGNVYLAQKKYDDARKCFLKGIRLAPHSIYGWMGLRHLALVKGDLTTFIRATLAILPRLSDEVLAQSIEILFNLNQLSKAEEILNQADRLGRTGDALDLQRLLLYQRLNTQSSRMNAIFKKICELPQKSDQIRKALARFSLYNKDFENAILYVNQMESPDSSAKSILWRALLSKNEDSRVRRLVQQHIKEDPDYFDSWFILAKIEASRGNRLRAERFLIRALENGFTNTEELNDCSCLKEIFNSLTITKECQTAQN
ncbi:MAG: tetratricopeptide repeat protein, partial [Fibrobacter sp.]|nr:tetratricopeptide repeat protein [Fibrobacter sp.]